MDPSTVIYVFPGKCGLELAYILCEVPFGNRNS